MEDYNKIQQHIDNVENISTIYSIQVLFIYILSKWKDLNKSEIKNSKEYNKLSINLNLKLQQTISEELINNLLLLDKNKIINLYLTLLEKIFPQKINFWNNFINLNNFIEEFIINWNYDFSSIRKKIKQEKNEKLKVYYNNIFNLILQFHKITIQLEIIENNVINQIEKLIKIRNNKIENHNYTEPEKLKNIITDYSKTNINSINEFLEKIDEIETNITGLISKSINLKQKLDNNDNLDTLSPKIIKNIKTNLKQINETLNINNTNDIDKINTENIKFIINYTKYNIIQIITILLYLINLKYEKYK